MVRAMSAKANHECVLTIHVHTFDDDLCTCLSICIACIACCIQSSMQCCALSPVFDVHSHIALNQSADQIQPLQADCDVQCGVVAMVLHKAARANTLPWCLVLVLVDWLFCWTAGQLAMHMA